MRDRRALDSCCPNCIAETVREVIASGQRSLRTMFAAALQPQFVAYVVIGVLTQIVDIAFFSLLAWHRVPVELAATFSISLATALHFTLNKYANFRNYDRHVGAQLRTYLVLAAVSFGEQIAILSVLTRFLHLSPLIAKVITNGANFPLNYLAHRYLTFGAGIRQSFIVLWRARRPDSGLAGASSDERSNYFAKSEPVRDQSVEF